MNSLKLGWIFPGIVLSVLITVVGVSIYQINSDGNPWDGKKLKYSQNFSGSAAMEPKMVKKPAIMIAGFALKTKTKNGSILKLSPNSGTIIAPMADRKNYIRNYSLKATKSTELVFLKILKMASLSMLLDLK